MFFRGKKCNMLLLDKAAFARVNMLQNARKTVCFKKNMVCKNPSSGEVNYIWPAA